MTLDHSACPTPDTLIEAATPGSDPSVRERVADHVITCAACADELRLLQAMAPWASEHAHLVAPAGAAQAVSTARRIPAAAWAYAAAAVLAAIAVGLSVEVWRLSRINRSLEASAFARATADRSASGMDTATRVADMQKTIGTLEQRLRAAEAPDVNPPIIDLEPADALRNAGRPDRTVIPAGARNVVFVLNTARLRPGAVFEVDIVDAGGRAVWTGPGLKQSADGTLTIMVPRPMVDQSSRVRLYSRAAGSASQRVLVEEYVLPARR